MKKVKPVEKIWLNRVGLILWGAALLILGACDKRVQLSSSPAKISVRVDGDDQEWEGAKTYFEKENLSLGMTLDDTFLYLCISATDPQVKRRIFFQGLNVWFDPAGGKDKKFGIHFPLGVLGAGRGQGQREFRKRGDEGTPLRERLGELEWNECEVLGPEVDAKKRWRLEELKGIELKMGQQEDQLVFEMKIPLCQSEDYPLAARDCGGSSGPAIGIGLETPKVERRSDGQRERGRSRGFGGGPRGGLGGGGFSGGRRGGRNAGGRGGGFSQMKPIDLWILFSLQGDEKMKALP